MQNVITQIGNFSYYNNKVIGQGATGLVYSGFRNQDKLPVAVKAIKLQDINTPVKKHLLDCEVLALKTLKNKFICQTYDVLKDNQFYYVPMQIFPNGTLRDYIKSKGKLPQFEALQMFSKIVEGYCAIRQAGFMHRDIKTENILLRSNMEPGIIDFGYCQKIETSNQSLTYNVGSPAYMSPEAYNDSVYSQKSDVWALGVVLHEMVTGTIPHMRTSDVDEYFRYLKNMKNAEIVAAGQSEACNRILLSALAVDSRVRCSSNQLLNMVTGALPQNSPMKKNNQNYEIFSPVLQRSNSMTKANQNLQFNRTPVRQVQQNLQNNKGWKFVPQQQINLVDLRQSDKISTKSNYSGSSQQQSPVLRQTIGNTVPQNISPQFAGLRKRIQSNVNFNLNLTPVRTNQQNTYTENNPYQYRQSPMNMNMNSPMSGNLLQKQRNYNNEPMTAMLPERQINYQNSPYGPRMKKSNSYGNLGVQLVHRF